MPISASITATLNSVKTRKKAQNRDVMLHLIGEGKLFVSCSLLRIHIIALDFNSVSFSSASLVQVSLNASVSFFAWFYSI